MKKEWKYFFLLVGEIILFVISIIFMVDDIAFILTKKEAAAEILAIEKKGSYKTYFIHLKYYNEYTSDSVVSVVGNIETKISQQLELEKNKSVKIVYGKYFPKEIHLTNSNSIGWGRIIIYLVFLGIILVAIIFSYLRWTKKIS